MASGSTARTDPAEQRAAIAAGYPAPISLRGKARILWRVLLLVLALLVLVPLHYLYRIVSYGSPFPKLFLFLAARIAGARVVRHGTPLRRDVFFISNHISWVDILSLAGASGTAFVAKAELGRVPVIGFPRGAGLMALGYRAQTGVDVVGLDWTMPLAQAQAMQVAGAVQGNLDPMRLAAGGEALDSGVDAILMALGNGPLVFNLGHGITPETPVAHVERMVKRVRSWQG